MSPAAVGLQTGDSSSSSFVFVQVLLEPLQETRGQWKDSSWQFQRQRVLEWALLSQASPSTYIRRAEQQ